MISKQNTKFYLFGDDNNDLLKTNKNNHTSEYVNDLLANSVTCLINKPTRITSSTNTLIDHIHTNDLNLSLLHGINISDLGDHNGLFLIISEFKNIKKGKFNADETLVRDMKNFNTEKFVEDLSVKLINYKVDDTTSTNEQFENFLSLFTSVVNAHAPLRIQGRKEQKLQKKPWLSSALLKSIKLKTKCMQIFKKGAMNKNLFLTNHTGNRAIEKAKQNH